ncbi:YozE family protein [Bacillus dakarensis]|uniref:YozE family protein n=1 Tax=Robertmurraya dakarensis TaxID=1926278 RepID=UPI0009809DA3|nr:YozE family protein [Bacillus dakarensis]
MAKSFFHFLMSFRHPKPVNTINQFANDAYLDHSFPKNSKDYEELSSYLELNGFYLSSMTVFDEAWEIYKSNEKKIYR